MEELLGRIRSYEPQDNCSCGSKDNNWIVTRIDQQYFALCPHCGYRHLYRRGKLSKGDLDGVKPFNAVPQG